MAKPFFGVGTAFPLRLDPATQGLARAEYEESVRQSILLILGTAPGERLMRPEFGCGIHDLVFAAISETTRTEIEGTVRSALAEFEPRIDVTAVSVSRGQHLDGRLDVSIDYVVRGTNNQLNIVYPFYIKERG